MKTNVPLKTILIIEDDQDLGAVLVDALAGEYRAIHFTSGEQGLEFVEKEKPDLVLLDLKMPGMDGFEVCQRLRERAATHDTPVIILTAEGAPKSRVMGLDLGADDYVLKPFYSDELLARIRARLRRTVPEKKGPSEQIQVGNLRVDPVSSTVWIDDEQVHLTQVEYLVLRYFLQFPNEMISRERLLKDIWSDGTVSIRTVDTHIAHLRKKLKNFRFNLRTVFRSGYILEIP
jgi:DNA-binding response OmpR family regulator